MAKQYWIGNIGPLDDLGDPIKDEFIDGKTRMGPWAIMTPATHAKVGVGLGLGLGQRYRLVVIDDVGRWLKVEG